MANRAYLPAVLLWATLTPALYKFARYCDIRYGSAVRQMPLETAAAAPQATVDPALYLAPALRCAPDALIGGCLPRGGVGLARAKSIEKTGVSGPAPSRAPELLRAPNVACGDVSAAVKELYTYMHA